MGLTCSSPRQGQLSKSWKLKLAVQKHTYSRMDVQLDEHNITTRTCTDHWCQRHLCHQWTSRHAEETSLAMAAVDCQTCNSLQRHQDHSLHAASVLKQLQRQRSSCSRVTNHNVSLYSFFSSVLLVFSSWTSVSQFPRSFLHHLLKLQFPLKH